MQFELASIFFFVAVGVAVPLTMLTLGWIVRPKTPNALKATIYECGEIPVQQAWFNFNPRFYIVALIFLIFDVEVAFTYPVAVVFNRWVKRGMGGFAFAELFVFIAILALGLAYVWRHGDLEWIRQARQDTLDKMDEADLKAQAAEEAKNQQRQAAAV
jgi:NADH-quinone oxidoreductase subunit A